MDSFTTHEGYALFNIGEYNSKEEALNKAHEYNVCLIQGKQHEGKTVKRNITDTFKLTEQAFQTK